MYSFCSPRLRLVKRRLFGHLKDVKRCPHHSGYTRRAGRAGMALVEVVLALGIITLSVLPLLGLLSIGCTSYRSAIEQNVQADIVQQERVIAAGETAPGGQNSTNYYREDGTATTQTDSARIYEAVLQAPAALASPAPSVLLVNQLKIIHVPSGAVLATEVIHVTPRSAQ